MTRARERGVVLFVAIIVLLVMSLAGLALMRQIGAGTSIAGNVAFKESATSVGDLGVEKAVRWLIDTGRTNPTLLFGDRLADGYYATWAANLDPAQLDWSDANTGDASEAFGKTGNRAKFIIHRLCSTVDLAPNAAGQVCSDGYGSFIQGQSLGGCGYGQCPPSQEPSPFYRITTRVEGPRNAISFVQVIIN